jgi:EmrB/QacA subfamily drug resistance transporter
VASVLILTQGNKLAFRLSFAGILLAVIVSSLDQNILSVALPRIASELGGFAYISWTVTAFLLASTISAPIYGRLSDMYGRPRLLTTGMIVFLAASLLCSAARSMPELIAARALQGLGAGGVATLAQSAIGDLVGPSQRGRYQGYFSGALAISTVLGPVMGGALIAFSSWRWIFVACLPFGIASLSLIKAGFPASHPVVVHRIDYLGLLWLSAATICALLFVRSLEASLEIGTLPNVPVLALAILAMYLFVRQERRTGEPLLTPKLFAVKSFIGAAAASGMMTFAMNGALVFLPLYLQVVDGQTPTHSGLMLVAQVFGMILSSVIGGRLSSRTGHFKTFLLIGVTVEMMGLSLLAACAFTNAHQVAFLFALLVLGIGTGLGMPNAVVVVQNSVPKEMLGIATASMSFLRSCGAFVGVALSGCLMSLVAKSAISGDNNVGELDSWRSSLLTMASSSVDTHNLHAVRALRLGIAASFTLGAITMLCAIATVAMLVPSHPRRSVIHSSSRSPDE